MDRQAIRLMAEAGSIDVVVTDANGCTASANATLNNPAPMSAAITPNKPHL
ncbi:MAG: hypothetical protein IPN94_25690 [Sphingobacteriales bacterium]|nr:hypothetical protein [Sphingobacteriales bacterium]